MAVEVHARARPDNQEFDVHHRFDVNELEFDLDIQLNAYHRQLHEHDSINHTIFEYIYQHSVDVLRDDYHVFDSACEHHHTAAQCLFSHHSDLPRHKQRNSFQLHRELQSVVCEFDDIQGQHHRCDTQ